jgi:hypoxanthine phosphoribosyltransferase
VLGGLLARLKQDVMEELLNYLKENFTQEKVAEMLDEEILNWVAPDWEEDYESEYDWYVDHNNKEAEDEVINQIIIEVKNALPNLPNEIDMYDVIKELYPDLD